MKVDKEHLKKLSKLCRIKCNDEELDSIEVSFKEIIAHFEEIKEVATQETPTCDRVTENVKCPQREDETGETLKREILVNTILPLLHEGVQERQDPEELSAFDRLYRSLPAAQTGKGRYLVHRFFGDTPKGAILKKAEMEQGAYQIHRDFCLHYEASCEGCPFVQRVKNPKVQIFSLEE